MRVLPIIICALAILAFFIIKKSLAINKGTSFTKKIRRVSSQITSTPLFEIKNLSIKLLTDEHCYHVIQGAMWKIKKGTRLSTFEGYSKNSTRFKILPGVYLKEKDINIFCKYRNFINPCFCGNGSLFITDKGLRFKGETQNSSILFNYYKIINIEPDEIGLWIEKENGDYIFFNTAGDVNAYIYSMILFST